MCPKQYESVENKPTDAKRRQERTWEKMERKADNGSPLRQPGTTFLHRDGISTSITSSTTKNASIGERIVFVGLLLTKFYAVE